MKHCINLKSPDFQALVKESNMHQAVLAAKMSVYMDQNNTSEWPTLDQLDGGISYVLKAADILLSDKAEQVFAKGNKNNWSLDKILTELSIPKDQKRLLLDLGINDREQLAIELQSRYGYNVEVKTQKKQVDRDNTTDGFVLGDKYYSRGYAGDGSAQVFSVANITDPVNFQMWEPETYDIFVEISREEYLSAREKTSENTQHYSNLTSPGGTNYRELEISTPGIAPSIKGHAKFATDKGIGWARVDDQLTGATIDDTRDPQIELDENGNYVQVQYGKLNQIGGESTKALRVLELQSDLFQKGRDKKDLATQTLIGNTTYLETPEVDELGITRVGRVDIKQVEDMSDSSDNKFLQLLNKDGNWITFFVKSVLQNATKEGYEKVLFPRGATAAKIEGHQALADELERVDNSISLIKSQLLSPEKSIVNYIGRDQYELILAGGDGTYTYDTEEEFIRESSKVLNDLETKKSNLKSQGIEKLRPIESFYEIKVKNILDKQFGKENVESIIDEHNNGWYQIDLSSEKVKQETDTIKFQRSNVEVLPLTGNEALYKDKNLVNDKGEIKFFDNYAAGKKAEASFNRSTDYQFILKPSQSRTKEGWRLFIVKPIIERDGQARIQFQSPNEAAESLNNTANAFAKSNTDATINENAPRSFTTASKSLFNVIDRLKIKVSKISGYQSKAIIYSIAKNISDRTGIEFSIISQEEAAAMHANWGGSPGMYDSVNKKAYLVEGLFDASTAVHEIFGHPFLDSLKETEEGRKILSDLLSEAKLNSQVVESAINRYGEDVSDDEITLAALDLFIQNKVASNSGLYNAIKAYFKAFTDLIKGVIGKSSNDIVSIKPGTSIEAIGNWAWSGEGRLKLMNADSEVMSMLNVADSIVNTKTEAEFNLMLDTGDVEGFVNSMALNEHDSELVKAWIFENDPATLWDLAHGMKSDLVGFNESISKSSDMLFQRPIVEARIEHAKDLAKQRESIMTGLQSRLSSLRRDKTATITEIEALDDLLLEINKLSDSSAVVKFLEYANNEGFEVNKRLDSMMDQSNRSEEIDAANIISIGENFLSMFRTNLKKINELLVDKENFITKSMSDREIDDLNRLVNGTNNDFDKMAAKYDTIVKYVYRQELAKIANQVGDSSMQSVIDNAYESDQDVSVMSLFIGSPAKSRLVQIRALDRKILDAKNAANLELSRSGYVAKLVELNKKINKFSPVKSFTQFYEKNKDGKFTGYITHFLKYGEFNANYEAKIEELAKKYNLPGKMDKPTNDAEYVAYNKELNLFLNEHAVKKFVPEYYNEKAKLSIATIEALDQVNNAISRITRDYLGVDGNLDTSRMTKAEKYALWDARKTKEYLSSDRYANGDIKVESDLNIANEIKSFNEAISGNLKYKANLEAFDDAKKNAKLKLSPEKYLQWIDDNTKIEYDEKFYEQLATIEKADQSPEWQDLYDKKQAILKRFKNKDTMGINVDMMEETRQGGRSVRDIIDEINETLSNNKNESVDTNGVKFSSIARMITTKEYRQKVAEMSRVSPTDTVGWAAAEKWFQENHTQDRMGHEVPKSYWMMIEPKNPAFIRKGIPNSTWTILDNESNFVNKEYDDSLSKNGMQPSKKLYDNSKAYNKLMSDPTKKEFYDTLVSMMTEANSFYSYINRPNNLKMPQIAEHSLLSAFRRTDNGKSLLERIKSIGQPRVDDIQFGEKPKEYRPDGSPIKYIPTSYRSTLENTNSISKDMIHMYAIYYQEAANFKHLSEALPAIKILQAGMDNTVISNKEALANADKLERDNAGARWRKLSDEVRSAIGLKKSTDRVMTKAGETHLSSRAKGIIEREVYGVESTKMIVNVFNTGIRFDIGKAVKQVFLPWFRAVNLGFNTMAIAANYTQSEHALILESTIGSLVNKSNLLRANWEIGKRLPYLLATITSDRHTDKTSTLMRFFQTSNSEVESVKDINGIKALSFIKEHWLYGPYSAGDFMVKSKMLTAMLMGYKYHNGEFVSLESFINKNYPGKINRKEAIQLHDALKVNLYDVLSSTDKGELVIKDEYKDAFNDKLISSITIQAADMGNRLDGMLSPADKNAINVNAFASALMMHRGWLVNAFQERLGREMYSYRKERMEIGQYRTGFTDSYKILLGYLTLRVNKTNQKINEMGQAEYANAVRTTGEIASMFMYAMATVILGNMHEEDPDDMAIELAYTFMMRALYEQNAMYSPSDLSSILQSPTAAQNQLDEISGIYGMLVDGDYMKPVRSGKYKGMPKIYKSGIKLIPGYKGFYENIQKADYRTKRDYMLKAEGPAYGIVNRINKITPLFGAKPETPIQTQSQVSSNSAY